MFAASLADDLDFRTMGNERKVIAAWLVRDIESAGPHQPDEFDDDIGARAGEPPDHAEAENTGQFGPPRQSAAESAIGTG